MRKPTKTLSGITPVAVMLPPRKCRHGNCIYCPSLNVPQSYTPKSPVVLRARALNYDSYEQVKTRLKAFETMGHPTEKIEIIIMGGTFLEYPRKFQYEFVKGIYDALNSRKSKSLELAKKKNETAEHRCVALCIETRPDVCCEFIERMREFGCTRVELGVQIICDKIYDFVKRGHKVRDVVNATKCLRDAGFKIGYHIMPGLPLSNPKKDLRLFKKIFSDEKFKPDQIKIYPCQVMPGSELENLYWKGNYEPYEKNEIENLIIEMLRNVPRYCRVMRIMREIPVEYLVAGTKDIGLRKDIEDELRKKKMSLKEIRYREVGFNLLDNPAVQLPDHPPQIINKKLSSKSESNADELKLKITKYRASGGREYFLEIINSDDVLFGLLRLRIINGDLHSHAHGLVSSESALLDSSLRKNIKVKKISKFGSTINSRKNGRVKIGIIRELHVYGQSLKLGEKGKISQHKGLGKELMKEAEEICRRQKCKEIKVISGVGVREYYRKLGYKLEEEGEYMEKGL